MAFINDDPLVVMGNRLWAWTGETSANWTLTGAVGTQRIQRIQDQSGRGHDFQNYTHAQWQPGYQKGYSTGGVGTSTLYVTAEEVCGLDHFATGGKLEGNVFWQRSNLNADGAFYLAASFANLRTEGTAPLWGSDSDHNVLLDQALDQLHLTVGGTQVALSAANAVPKGPVILEVWRLANSFLVSTRVNGTVVPVENSVSGTFALSGWGYNGTSVWRDPVFEIIMVDKAQSAAKRMDVQSWLSERWGITTSY